MHSIREERKGETIKEPDGYEEKTCVKNRVSYGERGMVVARVYVSLCIYSYLSS